MLRLFTFIFLLAAARAGAVTLPLSRAPDYALAHNPQLAAARLRIEEARGRLTAAGRLRNPEIELDFSQNVRTPERALGVAFTQRFPLTDRLRWEKAVSRAQLAAAEAEVRDAERKLVADVRMAAVKSAALSAQRDLRLQQLANSREQTQFVTERVAAGEASGVDASLLALETREIEIGLLQLETASATLSGELRLLLGVPASEVVEITGTLAAPGATPSQGAAAEGRADLEAARHLAEAAERSVGLARARRWEDIGVGLTLGGDLTDDAPEGFSNDYYLGFSFSLPLPLWNKNEGQIAEATAAAIRAGLEADALAFQIRGETEAARGEMAALARLIGEMDAALLPQAADVEAQLRTAYDAAQTPLPEVLRARSRRLDLAQRRLDALRDYHLARARYDAALGHQAARGGGTGK